MDDLCFLVLGVGWASDLSLSPSIWVERTGQKLLGHLKLGVGLAVEAVGAILTEDRVGGRPGLVEFRIDESTD